MREGAKGAREVVRESLDHRFLAPLRAYFTRRIGDRAEADGLTQEVFVRLNRQFGQGHLEPAETLVFKVASGVLQDWHRYRSARGTSASSLGDLSETLGSQPELVQGTADLDMLRVFEEGLVELDQRTREIFLLSQVENVSFGEIAASYGISVRAVEEIVASAISFLSAGVLKP